MPWTVARLKLSILTGLQQVIEVLVSRSGTIADLLVGLQKKANLDDDTIRHVRVFEAHSGKIYKELRGDFSITGLNEFVTLYAEKIPQEELNMSEGERLINAFNFDREPGKPHGVPLKFVVKPVSADKWVSTLHLQLLTSVIKRVRSSKRRKIGSLNAPASKGSNLRRSNLQLSLGSCTQIHDILKMVSMSQLFPNGSPFLTICHR